MAALPRAATPAAGEAYIVDHPVASDNLDRTTTAGWGEAQLGGSYTLSHAASFSSDGSSGVITLPRSGSSSAAALTSVASLDTAASAVVTLAERPQRGNGVYAGLQVRVKDGSYYQAQTRVDTAGSLLLSLLRIDGSTAKQVVLESEVEVAAGLEAGARFSLEVQVTGTAPVELSARAWPQGSAKPEWQSAATDASDSALVGAGGVALWSYVSSSTPPQAVAFDDFEAFALRPGQVPSPEPSLPAPPVVEEPEKPEVPVEPEAPPATGAAAPVDAADARGEVGAAPIGSTTYAVPAGALFVAPGGADKNNGSQAAPFATVQAAINAAKPGATVVLRAGAYHEGIVIPRGKGITLQPYPGEAAWLDGSRVLTEWARSGRAWAASGWTTEFDFSPTYRRGAPDNTADAWAFVNAEHPMAAHPDQVWIDGKALAQVASRDAVAEGTFFVDTAADMLYLGSDPAGHTVRASDTVTAATVLGNNSVIRGIGMHRFAPSVPDMGAVSVYADNVTIENVAITDSATTALSIGGSNATLRHVTTARNGMLGSHANYADGLKVIGMLSADNNTESFNRAPVSGGLKITRSRNVSVVDSAFLRNSGNALWFDESVYNGTVAGNDIAGNTGNALIIELSSRFTVADNVVANNGLVGVLIGDSNQVEVWNNTLSGNARNVNIVQGDRRASDLSTPGHDPRQKLPDPTVTWITGTVTVKNNILAGSTFKCNLCVEDYSHEQSAEQMRIVSDGNVYQRTSSAAPAWSVVWSRGAGDPQVFSRVEEFVKATGQDKASLILEGQQAVSGLATPTALVTSAKAHVARPLPGHLAALVGQDPGARHLGAWIP